MRSGKPIPIAKITLPNCAGVLRRERLFQLLETAQRNPVIWVTAPAGFGKTTLVASYLADRKVPCIWYCLDERDSDRAVFFHFMGFAAQPSSPKKPLLRPPPDDPSDPTVALTYFSDLYSRLRPPRFIVLDDYHRIPAASSLHECIAAGLGILPEGLSVIVLSRDYPPARFARLKANGRLTVLEGAEILFTFEETMEMLRLKGLSGIPGEAVRQMHERTRGWAAGLTLMMESVGRNRANGQAFVNLDNRDIFDYIAAEVFDARDDETQGFLMQSAFLPYMTDEWAEKLTGAECSRAILSHFFQHHLFVERNGGGDNPLYRYYPIFREFLLFRAKETLGRDGLTKMKRSAALLLADSGQAADALETLIEARDWDCLVGLTAKETLLSISQGRTATMGKLLSTVPKEVIERTPWLLYFLAASQMVVSPAESRARFERAFRLFSNQGDDEGTLLSWAGVVDTYFYECHDAKPLDRWIDWLDDRIRRNPTFPSPGTGKTVAVSMACALAWRRPTHPETGDWMARAAGWLQNGSSDRRSSSGTDASMFRSRINSLGSLELFYDESKKTAGFHPSSPFTLITTTMIEACFHSLSTDGYEQIIRAINEGLTLADNTGLHAIDPWLVAQGAYCTLNAGDAGLNEQYLNRMKPLAERGRSAEYMLYCHLACLNALLSENISEAVPWAEKAVRSAGEAGVPIGEALGWMLVAQTAHETGDYSLASKQIVRAKTFFVRVKSRILEFACELIEAYFALDRDHAADGLKHLRRALMMGHREGYTTAPYFWRRQTWIRLCVKALEAKIEIEYVQDLIRKQRLFSDGTALQAENWPWPVKIYVLGRFELLLDGKPLRVSGKAQRKPLQMLKMLAALGGNEVKEEQLSDLLWPESDGDRAHSAFTTTLSRLRRLIGFDRAIEVHDGRASLNPHYCWVDLWAFERIFGRLDLVMEGIGGKRGEGGDGGTNGDDVARLAERAIDAYGGPLLPGESDQSWIAPVREWSRNRFLRLTGRFGKRLEAGKEWERAVEFYRMAMEKDDSVDEELCQRLMICYEHLGQPAKAVEVYHDCRKKLAAVLGIKPSPKTEDMYRNLSVSMAARDG